MHSSDPYSFEQTPKTAARLQQELRSQVITRFDGRTFARVTGADLALDKKRGLGIAGAVTFALPGLEEIERNFVIGPLRFPYVPGLLSFREGPLLIEALNGLKQPPELLMFDGQGLAHPRRLGLASHVALLLDLPGIGAAKSRLVGEYLEPDLSRGSWSPLLDQDETIGAVVRTRDRVKPIFVSIGHRIDLETAIKLTLICCDGYRIPKPTRIADHFVAEIKRERLTGS